MPFCNPISMQLERRSYCRSRFCSWIFANRTGLSFSLTDMIFREIRKGPATPWRPSGSGENANLLRSPTHTVFGDQPGFGGIAERKTDALFVELLFRNFPFTRCFQRANQFGVGRFSVEKLFPVGHSILRLYDYTMLDDIAISSDVQRLF